MKNPFFIADPHFGHKGVINFLATKPFRPFETIEEHNQELVKRWNSVVTKNDTVWVVGDFCFGKANLSIANELNGYKKLVLGNHDMYASCDYLKYFNKLYGAVEFDNCIITHIPVHPDQFNRYKMNIHGHLHAGAIDDYRYFNVSAERIDLTPIPYDIIISKWAENN